MGTIVERTVRTVRTVPMTIRVVAGDDGLHRIDLLAPSLAERASFDESAESIVAVSSPAGAHADAAVTQLGQYFAGERSQFDLTLVVSGTEFQRADWRVLGEIGYGEVISYGEQARRVGRPTAVRAVGAANGRNPFAIVVPCHRVVGADGSLTGYAAGVEIKRWLLDHERAVVARAGSGAAAIAS